MTSPQIMVPPSSDTLIHRFLIALHKSNIDFIKLSETIALIHMNHHRISEYSMYTVFQKGSYKNRGLFYSSRRIAFSIKHRISFYPV